MTESRRYRVVLADDDPDVRFLARASLDDSGRFEVVGEAADGDQAVELAARLTPDVLLLDLAMPMRSGLEAIGPIRDASPATQIVILTNFSRDRLAPMLLERGALGYLEKHRALTSLAAEVLAIASVLEIATEAVQRAIDLPAELASPGAARRFVAETLAAWECSGALDTVALLVSEVVANAVVHAASDVQVAVQLLPESVRVTVRDRDPSPPVPRAAAAHEESGRGLALVEALSLRWGVDAVEGGGKDVWFETPRFDRAGSADVPA
jgi:DNA-binding NarL/FixJ family response regulator